jgi:hypothetical protein
MPPRTTFKDRNRKARIRENEYRRTMIQLKKLDEITDAQLATLGKIKAAEVKGKPMATADVADWKDLYAMGVVREKDGVVVLTSAGTTVVSTTEKSK